MGDNDIHDQTVRYVQGAIARSGRHARGRLDSVPPNSGSSGDTHMQDMDELRAMVTQLASTVNHLRDERATAVHQHHALPASSYDGMTLEELGTPSRMAIREQPHDHFGIESRMSLAARLSSERRARQRLEREQQATIQAQQILMQEAARQADLEQRLREVEVKQREQQAALQREFEQRQQAVADAAARPAQGAGGRDSPSPERNRGPRRVRGHDGRRAQGATASPREATQRHEGGPRPRKGHVARGARAPVTDATRLGRA